MPEYDQIDLIILIMIDENDRFNFNGNESFDNMDICELMRSKEDLRKDIL